MILKLGMKEFLFICVKKFTMYIWSFTMKIIFLRHLEVIVKNISVLVPSSKIVDQMFCFKNDHFMLDKPNKPIFYENLKVFFHLFFGMTFEKALLVDDMPHARVCLIFVLVSSSQTPSMSPTLTVITFLEQFSLTWNPCIHPKCGYINLQN